MHKFIYPSKDTYINNSDDYENKNFGSDEILEIYASNKGKKTVFTELNWTDVPVTTQSFGYEGAIAYSTSSLYLYTNGSWRTFSISSDVITDASFISNFSGRFTNVTSDPNQLLLLSGSAGYTTGSFNGSYTTLNETDTVNGQWNSGSFSGSLKSGAEFSWLMVNSTVYNSSPLTEDLTGTGSFINLTGSIVGKSNTNGVEAIVSIGQFCDSVGASTSGSFSGSITSSNFNGYIKSDVSSNLYWVDVTEYVGYFKGEYSGSFRRPETSTFLLYPEFSRTFLHFDTTELSSSISSNEISSSNLKFKLNLKACGARNLPMDYTIYAYPISQSWENGDGQFITDGSYLGTSWNYKNQYEGSKWYPSSGSNSYEMSDYLLNSENSSVSWESGGGTWYYSVPDSYTDSSGWICNSESFPSLLNTDLICSQSFSNGSQSDIELDVTNIVRAWLCGCVPNQGLILISSFELSVPSFNNTNGLLQFYSRESNTIYSPYIDVSWDNSVYNTGSLSPITGSTENLINIRGLKEEFKHGSKQKIYVFAREKYQLKQFNKSYQQPNHITPKYLPTSSYYMIKDGETEEVIIDHDEFSKLSCDPDNGNYFILDTSILPQERYYKIIIKIQHSDGTIDMVDTNKIFKITR